MWNAKKAGNDFQGLVIDEATGRTVAVSYEAHDAALLAAAPDMLAALDAIVRLVGPYMGQGRMDAEISAARAAISKAKGE